MHPSEVFKQAGPLSKAIIADIEAIFTQKKATKKEKLLVSTTQVSKVIWVDTGLARGFVEHQGEYYTSWFIAEREFVCTAFPTGFGSVLYTDVEFLEPTIYWSCEYSRLQVLYNRHPALNFAARALAEQLLVQCGQIQHLLRVLSPQERLNFFITHYPHIYQRSPLGHIASFLGIRQETLSRLRSQKCDEL